MTYLSGLFGFKEFCIIGLPGISKNYQINLVGEVKSSELENLKNDINKIGGPLELIVTNDSERLVIDPIETAREFIENRSYLMNYNTQAMSMCLVMANEVTLNKTYRNHDPLWEFLRHSRNAIAHNGKWHFSKNEPRNPAEWRGIKLDKTYQGKSIFFDQGVSGTLNLGDVIALLHDIEIAYPAMVI